MALPLALGAYGTPAVHGAISDLIRRHSANRLDVRDAGLEKVDLSQAESLIDLGCGFGFMAEGLARHAHPGTEIVGVDIRSCNREAFMARVEAAGCRGRFIRRALHTLLGFPSRTFDGATASYSLYFFPGLVTEVARVLRPEGFFVALTHSEASLRRLLDTLGLLPEEAPQLGLLHRFSAETGAAVLAPHFEVVEARPYPNALIFEREHLDDLLAYVRFKLPLVMRNCPVGADIPAEIVTRVGDLLNRQERLIIDKEDVIFTCRRPVSP